MTKNELLAALRNVEGIPETRSKEPKRRTIYECGEGSMLKPSGRFHVDSLVEELIPFCDSPCGHSSQYAYSEDGGKNIVCLICEREELKGQAVSASQQPRCPEHKIEMVQKVDRKVSFWGCPNDGCGLFISVELLNQVAQFFPAAPTELSLLTKRKDYHAEYVEAVTPEPASHFVPGPRFCAWCSAWQGDGENHSKFCDRPAQGTPEPPKVEEILEQIDSYYEAALTQGECFYSAQDRKQQIKVFLRRYFPPASQTPNEVVGIEYYRSRLAFLRNQIGFIERNFPELATPASTARTDEWVSVEERLPDFGDMVLVVADGKTKVGYRREFFKEEDVKDWQWQVNPLVYYGKERNRVTHWRELPAAPGSVPQAPKDECLYGPVGKHIFNPHDDEPRRCVNCGVPQAEPPK